MIGNFKIGALRLFTLAILFLALNAIGSVGYAQVCNDRTDGAIVARILYKFGPDPQLGKQLSHINIYSHQCAVELRGYTEAATDWDHAILLVTSTQDVVSIRFGNFYTTPPPPPPPDGIEFPMPDGRCILPNVKCNDICVPAEQCPVRLRKKKNYRKSSKTPKTKRN